MTLSKYKDNSKCRKRNCELKPRDQHARIKYYELFTPDMYFKKRHKNRIVPTMFLLFRGSRNILNKFGQPRGLV